MAESQAANQTNITLPDLPEIIQQICKPSVDINNLGGIISDHQDLAEEVLDTINAPYFNLVRNISSLDEAVRFLGQERIVKLATARCLKTAIFTRQNAFTEEIWSTSEKTAIACVLIAKELNRLTPESAYEAGLYHNTGMAILFNHFDNYRQIIKAAYKHESGAISAFEQHHLKNNHASIGAELAKKWHLSDVQCEVIKHHHSQKWINNVFSVSNEDPELSDMIAILKLAEYIVHLPGFLAQVPINHEWSQIQEKILEHFDLNEMKLERLKRIVKEQMAEIKV